jgi:ribosomal protein S18 acetylase RimI-like enzyme
MTTDLSCRPARDEDAAFLYQVYAGTRAEELAVVPWDAAQKEAFLRMQFHAQHTYYHAHYPGASYQVVLHEGRPVGRLYVDRRPEEIRIIDIALLPEHRNRGLGGRLLYKLFEESARAGKPIRIHVEAFNRAMRLYQRLGFVKIGDAGVYHLMERWPPA